jgi:pyridoxine kinase
LFTAVGNSAAVLPLQAFGIEVAAVSTALLSMRGGVLDAKLVSDLLAGVEERGLVDICPPDTSSMVPAQPSRWSRAALFRLSA